ncbi:DUF1572 family protein [Puia sp. P3]|uniref:DUF1572 family protein n=1 Tax=Puia sp. P3 TaxID=3423952 RepID=UPI003D66AC1C
MLNQVLANLYEKDLRKLIEEVNLFQNEENLWKILGTVKNSSGNLTLHIVGGLNHFFGAIISRNGYVRNRDLEFSEKGVARKDLVARLEAAIPMVRAAIGAVPTEQMDAPYPIPFDDANNSNSYVIIRLLAHLDYHLGQVNYLRRILEQG